MVLLSYTLLLSVGTIGFLIGIAFTLWCDVFGTRKKQAAYNAKRRAKYAERKAKEHMARVIAS